MTKYTTVDEYIKAQDPATAARMTQIRELFHEIVPETQESISYDMPTFTVGGDKLYMGAYKQHIGMYPMYGVSELDNEMLPYRGKDTVDSMHFRHDQPLPLDLIKKIITAKNKN